MDYNEKALFFLKKVISKNQSDIIEKINAASKGEMFVLTYLAQQDEPVSPGVLAVITKTSTARVATVLNNLENKGFIEREMDKSDRRKILVTITQVGKARVENQSNELVDLVATIFKNMGKADTESFIQSFAKFIDAAGKIK